MTPSPTPPEGQQIAWTPAPARASTSAMADFARWVQAERGVHLDSDVDYTTLHAWSVNDIDAFWAAIADYFDVRWHDRPEVVLDSRTMPGARWFPGGTLNYAEHALSAGAGRADGDTAVIFAREDGPEFTVTHARLRDQVARASVGLASAGVGVGDRVVAVAPNSVETLVTFLAAASLGAVWSSCSPDFGVRAVLDRFAQIEPTVLLAVDGYRYGVKSYDIRETVGALRDGLPTLNLTVLVPDIDPDAPVEGTTPWADFTADWAPLQFEPVPFDHPLWVLYSSGTTGLPKGIVHCHGGILLEHLKALRLHLDLRPGERYFWFTTRGWMMWNFLVSGLLVGAGLVLFDGNPGHPDLDALWKLADRTGVSVFGVSAPFIQACMKAGLRPRDQYDLSAMRALGSTGSPLPTDGYRWVTDACGDHIQTCSVCGGTDMCTAFLTSAPTVPVRVGELSVAALGADVHAFDEDGNDLVGDDTSAVGELVITRPMPSMPVNFWNDPDGTRLHDAYFDTYPGLWRHGDWVRATPNGSFVIYGRSDSTLNRGGIRMGTADFYAVVEAFDGVADSLVIDTTAPGARTEGALLCFLVLAEDASLDDLEPQLRTALRKDLSPRHVPDRFVAVASVPRTLNGKKCEVPVKKILAGTDPARAASIESLRDPACLDPFVAMAGQR